MRKAGAGGRRTARRRLMWKEETGAGGALARRETAKSGQHVRPRGRKKRGVDTKGEADSHLLGKKYWVKETIRRI